MYLASNFGVLRRTATMKQQWQWGDTYMHNSRTQSHGVLCRWIAYTVLLFVCSYLAAMIDSLAVAQMPLLAVAVAGSLQQQQHDSEAMHVCI